MKTKNKIKLTCLVAVAMAFILSFNPSASGQTKTDLKNWTVEYTQALSSPGWAEKMGSFGWDDDFILEHKEFRDAYADFKASIKFIMIENNDVMVWLIITAKHVGYFPHDELKDTDPSGKTILWNEIWHFDVINSKLGNNWDMLVNGVDKMHSAGVKCLPD